MLKLSIHNEKLFNKSFKLIHFISFKTFVKKLKNAIQQLTPYHFFVTALDFSLNIIVQSIHIIFNSIKFFSLDFQLGILERIVQKLSQFFLN